MTSTNASCRSAADDAAAAGTDETVVGVAEWVSFPPVEHAAKRSIAIAAPAVVARRVISRRDTTPRGSRSKQQGKQ
jgi:hypothetical protein